MKKIALLVLLCSGSLSLQAQTSCDDAVTVGPGIHSVSFEDGSDAPPMSCLLTPTVGNKGAWFKYMPSANHTTTVSTDVPTFPILDTRVHIYSGTCDGLVCVEGDDDSGTNNSSLVSFSAMAGTTYYIVFDNRWNSTDFSFSLTEGPFVEQMFSSMNVGIGGMYRLCVVDMNGDYLDDIVSPGNNAVDVLYQNLDGMFTSASLPSPNVSFMPGWSMAAGDYDKNGFNDLLYGAGSGASLILANSDGTGFETELVTPLDVFSQRTNFVDINNDGNLDAFVCHDVEPNVYFLNDGEGGFTFHQGGLGDHPSGGNYGSIWVDYDNDGDSDLFIAKCRGGGDPASIDELHMNNGDGTFTTVASKDVDDANIAGGFHQSWSSAWADFDNDGDMDALIGGSSGGHRLMENNGDGTFTDITAGSGYDTFMPTNIEHVAHDFNNDGYVDVFGGGGQIMFNNGDMTFSPVTVNCFNGPVGDLNNDGFLDIQNNNTIYLNNGNENNWIKIHLEGVESNRNGIGARVEIHYGDGQKQIRDVRSGDGFKYMSSLNTHFGLGEVSEITKVVVRWPSGTVDGILNPDINESLLMVEGMHELGTNDVAADAFTVFPNPAKDVIQIGNLKNLEITKGAIYDLNGRLVKDVDVKNNSIAVQSLAKGTYILTLQDAQGRKHSSKFIKE